jgi:hypothetical protein
LELHTDKDVERERVCQIHRSRHLQLDERGPMSDHFSGPRALAGPACDITDMHAFPSPERSGRLVLVLDVHPLAGVTTSFSDAIVYPSAGSDR